MDECKPLYHGYPHARDIGHVEEAAGAATSDGITGVHDVPTDVLADVLFWLRKGAVPSTHLDHCLNKLRHTALEGGKYCHNEVGTAG